VPTAPREPVTRIFIGSPTSKERIDLNCIVAGVRILCINQYFPPDSAASAYLLGELAEDLAVWHEVWVVAGRPSYAPDVSRFAPKNVRVSRVPSTAFPRTSLPRRIVNHGTFVIGAQLTSVRVPRPDIVLAFTDPPVIGLVGLLAARRYRAPFVYVCQDVYPDVAMALGSLRSPLLIRLWRRLNHLIRSRAGLVVAIGRDMRTKLEAEGVPAKRIRVLRNWGDAPSISESERRAIRQRSGWRDAFVLMHAGNMGLAQNLDSLVKAARLLADHHDICWVFLGDGPAKPRVESFVSRHGLTNVELLPALPKPDAQALMGAADLHVVSLAPGLWGCVAPSKVYGIMAAGRPFVAAVEEGSEAALLANDHECGIRVEPNDPESLASTILEARDLPLDEMGRKGRHAFEALYQRSIATAAYREALERLVETEGAPY
jgi:colanic acid biosynthesis glycosyl transferase WcaI